ncbi:MAG: hypothetical protein LBV62_02360 [Rickettsiales bacterium]|jgi:hypothetical protein|nr:hypothetical protein [Rickettsiales bacterium]
MGSVKLKAKFFFLVLILLGANNGYSDICKDIRFHTDAEATGSSIGKGFVNFFTGKWGDLKFDPHLLKEIKVTTVKDQGIDGYFNPKIQVCDYEGGNCYILPNKTSCQQIYGTQTNGAGISAAVFIDWEEDTILDGEKIKEGIAKGLEWEWVDNVTKEEQEKFAKSPKICVCSQKAACMGGFFSYFSKMGEGANIFRPGDMANTCDTCYQTKVKCAPVPLAPGPPPFCEQLAMSPPQVRIVPITNEDNDYFSPRVEVMISGLERKYLDFQETSHKVGDGKGTTYYFETYRKKDQLCAEYRGTEREESKRRLQFPARCFPAPPAPELKEVSIPKPEEGKDENTLKVKIKMSANACNGSGMIYSGDLCTFYVNTGSPTNIGPLSLKVVKPRIVRKTTNSDNNESNITDIIEGILRKNPQLKVLEQYGLTPNIGIQLPDGKDHSITNSMEDNGIGSTKWELDNMGQPKIEVRYTRVRDQENSKSKMLCLSGWQPEPEEFVLERDGKIIPLKSVGTRYIKYNAVYSKKSNQFYYLPNKENKIADLLKRPQSQLDTIIFNKLGYIFFPEENKQEKGKCNYCVDEGKGEKIDDYFMQNKVKVVYKLTGTDVEHEEECKQGHDGCTCPDNICRRSTKYKNKGGEYFFLKSLNGLEYQEVPIKANRTEIFYADKLCRFDLAGLKNRLREIIVKQLKDKKQKLEESSRGSYDLRGGYTNDLSRYDYVEIEAWGGGEAGHIQGTPSGCKDTNCSTENRPGMPGDYIKAKLKIDPNYPIIKVEVTEGGGGQEDFLSNKDGGPTFIKMCKDISEGNCKSLITVAGGGTSRTYAGKDYKETIIHKPGLKLEETIIKGIELNSTDDNKITYIEDGEIKYKTVSRCNNANRNIYGAGGCINRSGSGKNYSKGFPGYVKIKPMLNEIDESKINKINDAIEKMIQNPNGIKSIDNSWINKLDDKIIDTIREEIKKELLGL